MNPYEVNAYGKPQYIETIFSKAQPIRGMPSSLYRQDAYGDMIALRHYGKTTDWGWDVDHIQPKSLGGSNKLENLQPLQFSTNRSLGNRTDKKFIKTYYLRKYCMGHDDNSD